MPRQVLLSLTSLLGLALGQAPSVITKRSVHGMREDLENRSAPLQQAQSQFPHTRVQVFFTASDNKKNPVRDLKLEEISIHDKRQAQKIEYFSAQVHLPRRIGLLIDASGSRRGQLAHAERSAAIQFLRTVVRQADAAFLGRFWQRKVDFTAIMEDLRRLEEATVEFTEGTPHGASPLFHAIKAACERMPTANDTRRILVVLTDGNDNASPVSLDDVVRLALETNTAIHLVALPPPESHPAPREKRTLQRLSGETGGVLEPVEKQTDFAAAFGRIAVAIESEYLVEYHATERPAPGEFRETKIKVTRPGVKVTARRGYYGPKK